jgi:hypothetical protein
MEFFKAGFYYVDLAIGFLLPLFLYIIFYNPARCMRGEENISFRTG